MRNMTLAIILTATMLAVSATTASAATTAKTAHRCAPLGSYSVDREGSVRVFALSDDTISPSGDDFYGGDTVACDTRYNKWMYLFDEGSSSSTTAWAQSLGQRGHLLAFAAANGASNQGWVSTTFEVINLRTARDMSQVNVQEPPGAVYGEPFPNFKSVLSRNGTLAYATIGQEMSADGSKGNPEPYVSIIKPGKVPAGELSPIVTLDTDPTIDIQSLRLSGNYVKWNRGTGDQSSTQAYALKR